MTARPVYLIFNANYTRGNTTEYIQHLRMATLPQWDQSKALALTPTTHLVDRQRDRRLATDLCTDRSN